MSRCRRPNLRPEDRVSGERVRAPAGVLAALAAFALAGCGNSPYLPGETAGPVLYTRLADDPKTLDPQVSFSIDEFPLVAPVYTAYFRYHYLKRNPYVLELALGAEEPTREPYLCTVVEKGRQIRKRGEVWTFRIKPGLRFQDDPCFPGGKGREIAAADFLYSFRRMMDPAVPCPWLTYFQDKLLGAPEYVALNEKRAKRGRKADYAAPVAGLQLDPADPYVFRLITVEPYPQLRYLMAMPATSPLAHDAADAYGSDLSRHPVGCGPYVLAEYLPKQRIVLEKNPNRPPLLYPSTGMPGDREAGLLRDAGKQLPFADKVVFTVIPEDVTGWNLFLQGYQDSWGVTQTNYRQVMSRQGTLSPEMKRRGASLHTAPYPDIMYFAFNMTDPVLGGYTPRRRKLRQAVSLAVDNQAFLDLFAQGRGVAAQFLIPPGIFGWDASYRNPYCQHSLTKAKKLLAEAGYPGGLDPATGERLTLFYDNSGTTAADRQFTGLLIKQLGELGLRVVPRSWRYNVYQDKVDRGEFQFTYYGWVEDYPDPEDFLCVLYGPNERPGPNAAAYKNPEYDRLFERMRTLDDGPERLSLIRRMRAIVQEDCPWICSQHEEILYLCHDWVQNVKPHPVANDTAAYLRVDAGRRAQRQAEWNRPVWWPIVAAAAFVLAGSVPAARVVRARRRRKARRGAGAHGHTRDR